MKAVDPTHVLDQAATYGWAVYVLVLVIILVFLGGSGFATTYWLKVALPESRKRMGLMDKMSDGIDALVTTVSRTNDGMTHLSGSTELLHRKVDLHSHDVRQMKRAIRVSADFIDSQSPAKDGPAIAGRVREILEEES